MAKLRNVTIEECEVTIEAEQDDIPVRGNAMASDDPVFDKQVEDEILKRLDCGDVWAWACVTVVVRWESYVGRSVLGGCNYKDEAEFRELVEFEGMRNEALDDLNAKILNAYAELSTLVQP